MKQAVTQHGKYRVIEHRSYSVIEGPFYHTEQKCLGEYDTICEAWDRIREARKQSTPCSKCGTDCVLMCPNRKCDASPFNG